MSNMKRITLHPLLDDGTVDLNTNLYPKTLLNGIVDNEGQEAEVALKSDIPTNYVTTDTAQTITGQKTFSGLVTLGESDSVGSLRIIGADNQAGAAITLKNINSGPYADKATYLQTSTVTANRIIIFPDKSGTIALTEDCGTKLYRHQLVITYPDGEKTKTWYPTVISNKRLAFNKGDLYDALVNNQSSGRVYLSGLIGTERIYHDNTPYTLVSYAEFSNSYFFPLKHVVYNRLGNFAFYAADTIDSSGNVVKGILEATIESNDITLVRDDISSLVD